MLLINTYFYISSIFLPTFAAISMNTFARSLFGSETTVGFPLSASSQMLACNGMSPRKSIPCSSHACVTPELEPNMCVLFWQCGHVKRDIFWIMPNKGTLTVLNMLMPLIASLRAISWGVETIMAPGVWYDENMSTHIGRETYRRARSVV
jgi:hypothetical protein